MFHILSQDRFYAIHGKNFHSTSLFIANCLNTLYNSSNRQFYVYIKEKGEVNYGR